MPIDIAEFTSRFEDLLDETEASYVELIGTLELAKQRLVADALSDDDDELDDDDEYDDDDEFDDDDFEDDEEDDDDD